MKLKIEIDLSDMESEYEGEDISNKIQETILSELRKRLETCPEVNAYLNQIVDRSRVVTLKKLKEFVEKEGKV